MRLVRRRVLFLIFVVLMTIGMFSERAFADPEHNHDGWTAWTSDNSLPSDGGSYYLTTDVTLSSTWSTPAGTTNLCLNGRKISCSANHVINVSANSTLCVYDCSSNHSGSIEQTYEYSNTYRAINFDGEATTVEIYGGTIKAYTRTISCSSKNCSLVVDGENVEIISTGGNPYTRPGIGVYFAKGKKLEIRNSKLIKTDAFGGYGLYALDISENVIISGGTFNGTGCAVSLYNQQDTSYTVTISGGTFNGGVYLNSSNPTIVGGVFNGELSVENASKFITGGTYSVKPNGSLIADGYFAAQMTPTTWAVMDHVEIAYDPNGWDSTSAPFSSSYEQSQLNTPITLPTLDDFERMGWTKPSGKNLLKWNTSPDGGGTPYDPGASFNVAPITLYAIWGPVAKVISNDNTIVGEYNTLASAIAAAQEGKKGAVINTVSLLGDITLKEQVNVNKNIILEGNNHTITMSGTNAWLTIPEGKNVQIQNLAIKGSGAQYGIKAEKSTLKLNNVKIIGDISGASAAGLCVDGATVTIDGKDTEITAPKEFSINTTAHVSDGPSVLYIYAGEIGSIGNEDYQNNNNRGHQDIYLHGGNIHTIVAMHYQDKIEIQDGVIDTKLYGSNTTPQDYSGSLHSLTISGGKIKPYLDFSPATLQGGKFSLHPLNEKRDNTYNIQLVDGYEVFDNVETDSNDYPWLVASPVPVTFNANYGNSPKTNEQKVPENHDAILKANPFTAPAGKTFVDWNTLPNPTAGNSGTTYKDKARVNLNSSTTLYAQWSNLPATAPTISGTTAPPLTYGYSEGSISTTASAPTDTEYDLTYQWYSTDNGTDTLIDGATASTYTIPAGKDAGSYGYYCVVTATRKDNGMSKTAISETVTVVINKADPTPATVNGNNRVYDQTAQPLVLVTGNAVGGTMYYALSASEPAADSASWTTSIPTAINAGTYNVWYKVKGDSNHNDTSPVRITVNIQNATSTIADASMSVIKGQSATLDMTDTTGSGTRTWSLDDGAPAWVSISGNGNKATITAAPSLNVESGTYSCTVTVLNEENSPATAKITITVSSGVTIDGSTVTGGTYTGTPSSTSSTSLNGKSVTSSKTEFKSGADTILETEITITTESTDFTSTVNTDFLTVVSVDVSLDVVDPDFKNYAYSLDVTGLPVNFKLEGDVTSSDTVKKHFLHVFKITGTPAAVASAMVNIKPSIILSGGDLSLVSVASKDINLRFEAQQTPDVPAPAAPPKITTTSLPEGTVGQSYTASIAADTSVNWAVEGLPKGLELSSTDKSLTISGTPETSGDYALTVTAQNSEGMVSLTLALTIKGEAQAPAAPEQQLPGNDPYVTGNDGTTGEDVNNPSEPQTPATPTQQLPGNDPYVTGNDGTTGEDVNNPSEPQTPATPTQQLPGINPDEDGNGGTTGDDTDNPGEPQTPATDDPQLPGINPDEDGSDTTIDEVINNLTEPERQNLTELQLTEPQKGSLTDDQLSNIINTLPSLATLDLSGCTNIENVDLKGSQAITSVNLADCDNLSTVNLGGCSSLNEITGLSGNTTVEELNISDCPSLTEVDVSNCTSLSLLDCSYSSLESLNVDGCTSLQSLSCQNNYLEELNVDECTSLTTLDCSSNNISNLSVQGCLNLQRLYCYSNNLETLEVPSQKLEWLVCDDNKLLSLNLEDNKKLQRLDCQNNSIGALDIDMAVFPDLQWLKCYGQNIPELIVSASSLGYLVNIADYVSRSSGAFAEASSEAEIFSAADIDKVIGVKGYDSNGNEISSSYDSHTGAATFSSSPARVTYSYQTGFDDVNLDVAIGQERISSKITTNSEEVYELGSRRGCSGMNIGVVSLLLLAELILKNYRRS